MSRKTLLSMLSPDPKRSAEKALLAGDRQKAMESFARSGDWKRAAQLAAALGDDEKLVRYSLMDAFGRLPEGRIPDTLSAAELLAAQGHFTEAILLFEKAGAYLQAGEAALSSHEPLRAARYFKQAGAWLPAVRCFEQVGDLREALQTVEEGLRRLERVERTMGASSAGASRTEELNLLRADLLVRTGRKDTAAALVSSLPPSVRIAEILERAERFTEALQCYLDLGQVDEAVRLASRAPERERLRAQILLHTGRPAEAGDLLAQIGLAREAAAAYETAKDWSRAAYRWEAAAEPRRAAEAYEKAGRTRDAARCYGAAGMDQKAAEVANRGRSSGATKAAAVASRGTLQKARQDIAAGETSRAASLLLQIRPDEPGFAESAVLLAPLLIDEGFYADALSRLRQTPRGGTPQLDIERDYWEGRSLDALGQKEAAMACFEKVAARDPDHRDARERLEAHRNPRPQPVAASQPVTAAVAAEMPVVGGCLAGRYEILAELGRGGMAQVYKARDIELDEIVAVKALFALAEGNVQEETRLLREVQVCRRITHPNVVRVYDIGRFQGGRFVTMEYLEGRGLDTVIAEESPLAFERVRTMLSEIASGLQEAHSQGVIHRDLKPSNVIVTAGRLKILDFGIAAMAGLGARLTQSGFVMGTPMYMSPDQILGHPDHRSDLYSLGVLAYALIAGREPYEPAESTLLMLQQLQAAPPPIRRFRAETPEPWLDLLDRLLAKDPNARFQSAQEVVDALETLPA